MTTQLDRQPRDDTRQDVREPDQLVDVDPSETEEWRESLDAVIDQAGRPRATEVLSSLFDHSRSRHLTPPQWSRTDYVNTISPLAEPHSPATRNSSAGSVPASVGTRR